MTLLEVCFLPMLYFERKYVSLHPGLVRVASFSLLGWLCGNSGTMLWHIMGLPANRGHVVGLPSV